MSDLPPAKTTGLPNVVELLDELQQIRTLAPDETEHINSRDESPPGYSPPPSPKGHDFVRHRQHHKPQYNRHTPIPTYNYSHPDPVSSTSRHQPVYEASAHAPNHSSHNQLCLEAQQKYRRYYGPDYQQQQQIRGTSQPILPNHYHEATLKDGAKWPTKGLSCPDRPHVPLSEWLRQGDDLDEVPMPSDWLAPHDGIELDTGSIVSCGRSSNGSAKTRAGQTVDATHRGTTNATTAGGDGGKLIGSNVSNHISVVTTPPQRSARPQTLCLDFPTPPSEFLSSDSPRRRRTASWMGPFSLTNRKSAPNEASCCHTSAGKNGSTDERRLEEGHRCSSRAESSRPLSSMLSFRSEASSTASLDSASGQQGQGTPLVWSANSRRCSRELLDVPNRSDVEMLHMRSLDLHPPPYRDHCSMPDAVWRAHSTEVIGRHSLHMDEIAHMAKDQNMVRRRSADLLEECLRRHTQSLSEVDTLQMVGLVTANQIVSKRRWRRMVLRERAVDTFAVACGGTCCIACLYACVAYFFLPGTWPTVFGPCEDPLCALK